MVCPNCGKDVKSKKICEYCGVDFRLLERTVNISNSLYNRGLQKALQRDISGAIENFTKSVEFNKNNSDARNALGLCYFESGRIGDALKHWVISGSFLKEGNVAKEYINKIQSNTRMLENYADSIKMYNQALVYLQQKSEDMAVIQLKKSLDLNPNFTDALNLLTLCYFILKDKEKAQATVIKTLAVDVFNPLALRYYSELNPGKTYSLPSSENTKKAEHGVTRRVDPYLYSVKKQPPSGFPWVGIIGFIAGAICVVAVMQILFVPQILAEKDQTLVETTQKFQEQIQRMSTEAIDADNKVKSLQEEINVNMDKIDDLSEQLDKQERINKINNAANLERAGKSEEAADILYTSDTTGLPVDIREMYDNLVKDIYPKVANALYTRGYNHFNRKEYDEAKTVLEKAGQFVSADASNAGNILYYLGATMEALEDTEAAINYYEEFMEKYPRSNLFNTARRRLEDLRG